MSFKEIGENIAILVEDSQLSVRAYLVQAGTRVGSVDLQIPSDLSEKVLGVEERSREAFEAFCRDIGKTMQKAAELEMAVLTILSPDEELGDILMAALHQSLNGLVSLMHTMIETAEKSRQFRKQRAEEDRRIDDITGGT